jgi:hypothetical protein
MGQEGQGLTFICERVLFNEAIAKLFTGNRFYNQSR